MSATRSNQEVTVIKPAKAAEFFDIKELIAYRDLFYFLVWRDIKVLYAQTVLGLAWAILNPVIQIAIFTIIFGKVANLPTDGIPYVLFSAVAIIPWTYMSEAMNQSSQSLVTGQAMLGKVYFPRILFPLTSILATLVAFVVSLVLLMGILFYYDVAMSSDILYLPIFLVVMMLVPAGVGLWLSALAIRYRDVKFIMPFVLRMLIYSAPILYSASSIPSNWRFIYSLNPIVSVVEGFRGCFLGTGLPWEFIWPGVISALVLFISGTIYFRRMEKVFVDVI